MKRDRFAPPFHGGPSQRDNYRHEGGPTSRSVEDEVDETYQSEVTRALQKALSADVNMPLVADPDVDVTPAVPEPVVRSSTCSVCDNPAKYTCPKCSTRTCSLACVKVHKESTKCTGTKGGPTEFVPLSSFSDSQLSEDFRFLEDVRRTSGNMHRGFPSFWRYSFRALPPPLHALREAAKKRGVVCQIMTEGMQKRTENASRYCRRSDSIVWRVEFVFHAQPKTFKVATDWACERFHLNDILRTAWQVNPRLPAFHIHRKYNRASQWLGQDANGDPIAGNGEGANAATKPDEPGEDEHFSMSDEENSPADASSADDMRNKMLIDAFLANGADFNILYKAERLGCEECYYPLDGAATLHDNLRSVFFINEFPVLHVVKHADMAAFPLITEEQKVRVRETFRKKEKPPPPEFTDEQKEELRRKLENIPCRNFAQGSCIKGDECFYKHLAAEDIPACRSMVRSGKCDLDRRCSFNHDPEVVRAALEEFRSRGRGGRGGFRGGRGSAGDWRGGRGGGFNNQFQHPPVPAFQMGGSPQSPQFQPHQQQPHQHQQPPHQSQQYGERAHVGGGGFPPPSPLHYPQQQHHQHQQQQQQQQQQQHHAGSGQGMYQSPQAHVRLTSGAPFSPYPAHHTNPQDHAHRQ